MSRQKRNFSARFESDIVIGLLEDSKYLNTLVTKNNIQPNLFRNWKKKFLNSASAIFDDNREENLKDTLAGKLKDRVVYNSFLSGLCLL